MIVVSGMSGKMEVCPAFFCCRSFQKRTVDTSQADSAFGGYLNKVLIINAEMVLAFRWKVYWHTRDAWYVNKNRQHFKNNFMKKIITFAAAALITLSSFATPAARPSEGISGEIKLSFSRSFKGALLMDTEAHEAFTKLTFSMNNVIMSAFYSNGGELLAVTRNIVSTQLPLSLMLGLKNDYSTYWITELFEFNGSDETNCYYVSLESADRKVTLRSNGDRWEVYTNVEKK